MPNTIKCGSHHGSMSNLVHVCGLAALTNEIQIVLDIHRGPNSTTTSRETSEVRLYSFSC